MSIGAGKKKTVVGIGLEDAINQYYKWKWKQKTSETCVKCKKNPHQMQFEAKIMDNGDRHLIATCPNTHIDINMGRVVHITKQIEAREMARNQTTRQAITQKLNRVFEYSKQPQKDPDLELENHIPSDDQLANIYIYEHPPDVEAQSIRRQMADLHENAVSYASYETELETRVKEWMRQTADRKKTAQLPGSVRGTFERKTTRDANMVAKYPRVESSYMYHYTSDPRNLAVSIGNVPMVIRYE
jgi:hypothetical protein